MILDKKLLVFLLLATLFSCKNQEEEDTVKTTYISGQIINPTCDYIIFTQGGNTLDTVNLDSNNFFYYKTDNITAGLHSLKHNEFQVFYIEPGDSLLLHVNTVDFDESLAYSGKGSEQNNLLMDLYLQNEMENKDLPRWYTLSPSDFESKIDSIKALKISEYEDFIKENKVAEDFKKVALASISYDYYSKKEMYAAANMRTATKIDARFFDYRKKSDFQRDELRFFYPYVRFMNRYFDNMVCSEYDNKAIVDRSSLKYNYRKIQLIDSIVKADSLKNKLLTSTAWWYMLNSKDAAEEKRFFETYSKINSDKKTIKKLGKLIEVNQKITAGNTVPNVLLVNTDNVLIELESVINTPTVVYFWSGQPAILQTNLHIRAAELKSKYPEYDFIGINTDTHFKKWRSIVYQSKYDSKHEFQIDNIKEAEKKLLLKYRNNVLILDENAVILEGKTNMFNVNFEQQLLGFLNR